MKPTPETIAKLAALTKMTEETGYDKAKLVCPHCNKELTWDELIHFSEENPQLPGIDPDWSDGKCPGCGFHFYRDDLAYPEFVEEQKKHPTIIDLSQWLILET